MKVKLLLPLLLFAFTMNNGFCQDSATENAVKQIIVPEFNRFDLGFGFGLDYGGVMGIKFTYSPLPYLGVMGNVGYELVGVGWNVGILGRFVRPDKRHVVRPYAKVMYGVNGATMVKGDSKYDQIFYGFSAGAGLELRWGKFKTNGINFDLNVPFHKPDYYEQISKMQQDPRITGVNDPSPVTFSLGYHFNF